ncbi:hypothetical protein [Devosia sp. 2618]|uniref:hypothetical protein n=1 Tax=Devosia sp. 2618 TaxID=3156454 RepID=UPI003396D4BE
MNKKAIITAASIAAIALASVAQAQAYKLHYWQDGTVSWMCNDGITVGVLDDGSAPSDAVVTAACADYGGLPVSGNGGKASTRLVTVEKHVGPAPGTVKIFAPVATKRTAPLAR